MPQTLVGGGFQQSQPRSSVRLQNYGFVLPVSTKVPTVGGDALGIVATAGLMGVAGPDLPTFDGDLHRSVSLRHRRDGLDRSGRFRQGPLLGDWLVVLLTLSSVAMFVCAAPTFASACELDNEGNCHPVPCQKLNPNVLMMQPAEDRYRNDLAAGLGASKVRRVLRQ